jgi:trehalose synthase
MKLTLGAYEGIVGSAVLRQLRRLGEKLTGLKVVHVNSTRAGGGVAEILDWMVPLMRDVGVDAGWEVIEGNTAFFNTTKGIHNALQGNRVQLSSSEWNAYHDTNGTNAERLRPMLEDADIVVIHDPQPAPLFGLCPDRKGKWIWRCHIDVSRPYLPVWKPLREIVQRYDASIFHMSQFAQLLPHQQYLIPPSIDPLSAKNRELAPAEIESVRNEFNLDPSRPLMVQISRFDRFKDPVGVIEAYRLVRKILPVQLVLAGGAASDDPEGQAVLEEVLAAAHADPDIHVLCLPSDAHRTVNALQRLADIIVQKSTREGFGLTVTEGLWKGKPVIGGDVGGIRLQVINHQTGFLVNTPEGLAHRVRFLLRHRNRMNEMGETGRRFVLENYLLTRHLRDYLTMFLVLRDSHGEHTMFI